MAILGAAVVVLAVVVLLNLLITFAVLRRLRSHESLLAGGSGVSDSDAELLGRTLPEFDAVSTAGAAVTNTSDTARMVGFFSATCAPCRDQAAAFAVHDDPNRVAFVLMEGAPEADRDAILAALAGSPTVVVEPASTQVTEAMGVRSFPQILQLDATGVVVSAGHSVRALAGTGR
ncbi:TlpA family protein disulfide reductase [Pseudonocardia sp. CA-107938]|uniref:TlpA family protein disulfide reductase n=1 Tax=Pseudonocardia sp. CA-107938 TaxID=3240021 RepID=UPI003D8D4870